jgi:formylglycine-generating enzyme required for sulfatase activity
MSFVHVGEVCPDLLWSVYETRLSDFRVFCEDTGRPSVAYDTNLWDARKDERAFMERLNAEERRRYESLEPPEQRARFMEGHSLASERQARLSHPVTKATFVEIEAFAQWLTLRERERGGLPPHLAYRLPTDLEWSAAVGASEGGRVSDPEQSGLTLLNLVEAEVLSREALSQRGFRMGNLGNVVVTPTVLESLEPATRSLILHAVKRQQLKMRIDRARRASPLFPVTAAIHVASDDTLPVQHTASNALGLHGLEGNVSEVMYDSRDFYQMVLRGPSFYTRAVVDDPTSAMNLKTRMLASKEVRNLSFGFRLVLAPERSEKVP